ncbi:hypothetical protein H6G20_12650 [Desertifilum sp. FACHB-1129]|uniref:Uncharacterized protein n=2 Tax=Desertifilum tharense IPPAS B-1220 TaxID=1781255 RepID=A0A1E5QLX1_9CYAN|nr:MULTISPECIES: hypothetical protein [Desertifilum]MCD8487784.1 hypothetical protein [Desertifilum sp.]MDA0212921.1 hypothetical protein [Cyanobacteria bacterium FC1]MBD2312512.1 hypothetical protein [Desertifilum sp. FACHB-1129]MBD2323454.1 hypothetical protein [Desertifilum sp. FACHB-866]MBD2333299.1 hypothetical protein [Desertifilum sp. FACHB-868]
MPGFIVEIALQSKKQFLLNLPILILASLVQDLRYRLICDFDDLDIFTIEYEAPSIIIFDDELRCVYIDKKLMKQVTVEMPIGEPLHRIMSNLSEPLECLAESAIATRKSIQNYAISIQNNQYLKIQERWLASFYPLFLGKAEVNQIIGVLISFREK